MDSGSGHAEKGDHVEHTFDTNIVDVAAKLTAGSDFTVDLQTSMRLRKKIDWNIMPLMCILYLMTFSDKAALGQSAVLGLIPGAHLTRNQFNWLGTIFYLSYLLFQYPQNLALQYFPVGKWMSINVLIWAIALCTQAACHSFGAIFACRFIMGMCEGVIIPGFLIVTAMFYTREEQIRRTAYWYLMTGIAIIFLGFLSFGVLHITTGKLMPWQWLMIITGILTLITSVAFWFFFPDSPTNAWFLTPEERVLAVQRIKVNQAGVENKHWKRDQFIEALRDPKTWVMALFTAFINIPSSLTNQRQIIVNEFGFTPIQTTLLGCVDGVVDAGAMFLAVKLATRFKNGRGYIAALFIIPSIVGSILVNTLPSHNKVGLLVSYWMSIFVFSALVILFGWIASITAGHTKRITTNAIIMCAYAIGNAAGPFVWKEQYLPRNHIPWTVLTASSFVSGILILLLRFMLAAENKRREAEPYDDTYDDAYIVTFDVDGKETHKKVDKSFLDLTDKQNREFRYVL
jgi:MFS family permease